MSPRPIAKNRFHKGVSAYLRRFLRRFGVSFDEEMAQFALAGARPFQGVPDEALAEGVNLALANRRNLMAEWEAEHPGANPFPPPFPQRVLRLVAQALEECHREDDTPVNTLLLLQEMCEKELDTEAVSVTDSEEI